MKIVPVQQADLRQCLKEAQQGGVLITQKGKPIGLLVSVKGLDLEQIELGRSDKFWKLVRQGRSQPTLSRSELDKRLDLNGKTTPRRRRTTRQQHDK